MIGGFGERRGPRPIGSVGRWGVPERGVVADGELGGGRPSGRRGYRTRLLAVGNRSIYPHLRCGAACWRRNSTSTPSRDFALVFKCTAPLLEFVKVHEYYMQSFPTGL